MKKSDNPESYVGKFYLCSVEKHPREDKGCHRIDNYDAHTNRFTVTHFFDKVFLEKDLSWKTMLNISETDKEITPEEFHLRLLGE